MLNVDNLNNWDNYTDRNNIEYNNSAELSAMNFNPIHNSIDSTSYEQKHFSGNDSMLDSDTNINIMDNCREIINSKEQSATKHMDDNILAEQISNNNISNDIFDNNSNDTTIKSVHPSKDIIIGNLMKRARKSGNSLLFAIISNIKSFDVLDDKFSIVCDQIANYEDIMSKDTYDFISTTLKEIDSTLTLNVQLLEDKSDEVKELNVRKLRAEFGDLIKIVE